MSASGPSQSAPPPEGQRRAATHRGEHTGALLELRKLHVSYGGIKAVRGIDLTVDKGELVCLIGANGAGKTTTLKAICGLVHASHDSVHYDGQNIVGTPSFELVRRGLAMVPEGRGVFGQLTIEENLAMGAYVRSDASQVQDDIEHVFTLFPRLRERRRQAAGTLSGGEQQMLAMGRALLSRPTMLLLDEPSMGLSPIMVQKVFDTVRQIAAEGVTILLIEQNAKMALETAHRGYVMESGEITLAGEAKSLLDDPKVRQAYLGEG
jgi:branched-chain amino acid transport system ATP-binding protein